MVLKSSVPLLFYGMSLTRNHEVIFPMQYQEKNVINWLCTRRLNVYGIKVHMRFFQGPDNSMFRYFDGLQELCAHSCPAEDLDFTDYPHCPSLTSIALPVKSSAALLRVKECYPKLQKLRLVLDMKIAEAMSVFPNLVELSLDSQSFGDFDELSDSYPSLKRFIYANSFYTLFPESLLELS
jgi:hypothetical protein